MPRRTRRRFGMGNEQGTILVITVVAMLILGILAISFAALGDLEARIGMNDVWDKQAAFVAEGGLAAVRNQIGSPTDFTAFLIDPHVYSCTTTSCTCSGTGCATARLATMTTGEFSVRIDNDPDDPSGLPTVDGNKRVMLTALGITRGSGGGVMGRIRLRAWVSADDPWHHVCSSGDSVLCTDPPNNQNADVDPPDGTNGPATYPEIPRPNDISHCNPVPEGNPAAPFGDPTYLGPNDYPVPSSLTYAQPPLTGRGPCVIYPYYLIALKTACSMCNPPTFAYDPVTCKTGDACLGMVRFDANLDIRSGSSSGGRLAVPGGTLGSAGTPATLYVTGSVRMQSQVGTVLGTIILHGDGVGGTGDLDLAGPHTISTQGPACRTAIPPTCAYPLAILAYNPNEPIPGPGPAQTVFMNISNNNITINGMVYTGGTADFGPNSVNGAVVGYDVNANNAATEFTYTSAYENYVPPLSFTTPAVNLPAVVARGTWLQCRTAHNLTDPCD